MRGIRRYARRLLPRCRSIPACAGNTLLLTGRKYIVFNRAQSPPNNDRKVSFKRRFTDNNKGSNAALQVKKRGQNPLPELGAGQQALPSQGARTTGGGLSNQRFRFFPFLPDRTDRCMSIKGIPHYFPTALAFMPSSGMNLCRLSPSVCITSKAHNQPLSLS